MNSVNLNQTSPRSDDGIPVPEGFVETNAGPASKTSSFKSQRLLQLFRQAVSGYGTIEELLPRLSELVQNSIACDGLWVCQRNEAGQFSDPISLTPESNDLLPLFSDAISAISIEAADGGQIRFFNPDAHPKNQMVAAPIDFQETRNFVLVAFLSLESESAVRQQWLMGIAAEAFAAWLARHHGSKLEEQLRSYHNAFSLVRNLDRSTNLREAAIMIVNHLRQVLDASQVALTYNLHGDPNELLAISDVEQIDLKSESTRVIKHAAGQAITAKRVLRFGTGQTTETMFDLALESYLKIVQAEACWNIPLRDSNEQTVGSVLIAVSLGTKDQDEVGEQIESLTELLAGHLDVVFRANRGLREVASSSIRKISRGNYFKWTIAACLIFVATLCLPLSYRIACDCELRPVTRRFIASPYEGILEKTLVENGDVVSQGQTLAKMDGRQLRMELAGLKAEFQGAKKKSDASRAQRDIAQSQISRSDMQRLQAEIELLQQRLNNLDIRSPIDGIVVHGDLEKVEGARMEMGQALFEVGPLNKMVAEVQIPESEIRYVKQGQPVKIKLDALPFETYAGTITRISPQAELLDQQSVFVAQVVLDNGTGKLRPGLNGAAKIQSEAYPLGWNLFHNAWESIRCWTVW